MEMIQKETNPFADKRLNSSGRKRTLIGKRKQTEPVWICRCILPQLDLRNNCSNSCCITRYANYYGRTAVSGWFLINDVIVYCIYRHKRRWKTIKGAESFFLIIESELHSGSLYSAVYTAKYWKLFKVEFNIVHELFRFGRQLLRGNRSSLSKLGTRNACIH